MIAITQTVSPMNSRNLGLLALLIAIAGCEQPRADSALSALQVTNAQLTKQLESANKKIEESDTRIASLEAAWKQFEQNFEANKRVQLAKNVEALEQLLDRVAKDTESSATVLKGLQQLEKEMLKLKDLCVKHESESSDANQVGKIKELIGTMEQKMKTLETSLGANQNIGHKILMLENSVRMIQTDVQMMKIKVR